MYIKSQKTKKSVKFSKYWFKEKPIDRANTQFEDSFGELIFQTQQLQQIQ